MCGRYVVISKLKAIQKRFRTKPLPEGMFDPAAFGPNPNVSIGDYAPVITNEFPDQLQLFRFGMTPFWAKKQMYLFNARSEGDHNKADDPQYRGAMGIINKPAFRHAVRYKRCLVIVDGIIEGSKKDRLNRPYLIYMRDGQRPFALAGIWDVWTNKETGELIQSFSIITTVANDLLQKVGHHRSPVILSEQHEQEWLDGDLPLGEVTDLLQPYPAEELNAYPISPRIKSPKIKDPFLLEPMGERIYPEYDYELYQELKLEGMGMTQARKRKNTEAKPKKTKNKEPPDDRQGTLF